MPSPYVYTRRRRLLMQGVMIAIFAATMGLAAVVRNAQIAAPPIKLGSPMPIGVYLVSIPEQWTTKREWRTNIPPVPVLLARDGGGHKLTVAQHFLDYDITPEAFLTTFHDRELDDGTNAPITIAGRPGLSLVVRLEHKGEGGSSFTTHQFGILIVDHRLALSVELESPGAYPSAIDRKLFREIAGSIQSKSTSE